MKELTKYSRLAGYFEKLYDKLNADFFDSVLDRPVITIQSSSRSYGHYTLYDAPLSTQYVPYSTKCAINTITRLQIHKIAAGAGPITTNILGRLRSPTV